MQSDDIWSLRGVDWGVSIPWWLDSARRGNKQRPVVGLVASLLNISSASRGLPRDGVYTSFR